MEIKDLTPQDDPKGGMAPPSGNRPKTPSRGIRVSEFDDYKEAQSIIPTINFGQILAWVFRGALVIAFLWLKATFVTNEKYDSDKGKTLQELVNISNTLVRIDEKLGKGSDTDKDHEDRLRKLEHGNSAK